MTSEQMNAFLESQDTTHRHLWHIKINVCVVAIVLIATVAIRVFLVVASAGQLP